ncbi:MAG: FKBP-type peptidyl-prolyl cis-trans isomerase [Bacteroidales bacterium]|nr:FKBP-type peptidyl-prolyl cis-trans isomerase [Bacteroidales bacterium]
MTMKRSLVLVATGLLLSAVVTSCGPKSPFPGYKATENGLYYKQITKGTGEQIKDGDVVKVDLAYYINDSLLYSTDSLPEQAYDLVHESFFKGDLYDGFRLMHVGDSMSFMINGDSLFTKQFRVPTKPDFLTPGAYLRWEVKVDQAMTEEDFQKMKEEEAAALQQASKDALAAYLAENGITAQPTETGLVYVQTKPGKGRKPQEGQNVKVHYTGRLLDGTVFDSSIDRGEPIEFPLGAHQVIPGWDEGIAMMSKGEKGILYIPYDLAYGPRQTGPIPAYSNLIFEVELVDFK